MREDKIKIGNAVQAHLFSEWQGHQFRPVSLIWRFLVYPERAHILSD